MCVRRLKGSKLHPMASGKHAACATFAFCLFLNGESMGLFRHNGEMFRPSDLFFPPLNLGAVRLDHLFLSSNRTSVCSREVLTS
jgi:hypothetical protein